MEQVFNWRRKLNKVVIDHPNYRAEAEAKLAPETRRSLAEDLEA